MIPRFPRFSVTTARHSSSNLQQASSGRAVGSAQKHAAVVVGRQGSRGRFVLKQQPANAHGSMDGATRRQSSEQTSKHACTQESRQARLCKRKKGRKKAHPRRGWSPRTMRCTL